MKKKNDGAATAPNPQQRRRMPKLVEMKALPMEQLAPPPDAEAFGAEEESAGSWIRSRSCRPTTRPAAGS